METVTLLQSAFDLVLGVALLWLVWQALASPDLFRAIVLFIASGLLMALVWVRLDAPDIALAEAAIGAGLTGALLLVALARLESGNETKISHKNDNEVEAPGVAEKRVPFRWLLVTLLLFLAVGLGYAVLSLPAQSPGLSDYVTQNIKISGVSNPVTAVLLNFRGYDTLLEMAVLLLALLGVWSLSAATEQREASPGPVLDMLSRLLVPLLILVAGYLLWAGAHAPGGAFQAGAVLGAAGVLLLLTGWRPGASFSGLPLRITLVMGLGVFIAVGIVLMLTGRRLLEYPASFAGMLILLIEAAATLSIGITLAALFLGSRPGTGANR